jgi:tRNA(Ile2)-agmatinylcytidine synthase
VVVRGIVATNARLIPRRHVIFQIKDESAQVDCAAYEPTGNLRRLASELIVGDSVEVYGAVRVPSKDRPLTINLEKIRVLKLAPKTVYQNPICPKCTKRLKSMGRNQGFRCERCGFKSTTARKVGVRVKREIKRGLYITSARSQRHLTKPSIRYGMEKSHVKIERMIDGWHFP